MGEMLQGMVTEEELLKLLGLTKGELSRIRLEKGLPYVKLSMKRRVYLEEDLMEWFRVNKVGADVGNRVEADDKEKDKVGDTKRNGEKRG